MLTRSMWLPSWENEALEKPTPWESWSRVLASMILHENLVTILPTERYWSSIQLNLFQWIGVPLSSAKGPEAKLQRERARILESAGGSIDSETLAPVWIARCKPRFESVPSYCG